MNGGSEHYYYVRVSNQNTHSSTIAKRSTVELGYNVMKGTQYFVSLYTSVVITEQNNVMVNSKELIATTEYLTL